jgi:hypothetical protein
MPPTSLRPLWIRAAVVGAVMILLDLPLRTAAAPHGIVSFELAWTAENAAAMIASWTGAARLAGWGSLLVDYLFMWSYAALLAALARQAFPTASGRALAGAAWAAAAFDAVENAALIRMFGWGATDTAALTAGAFASVKFALLAVVVVAVVGAAVRRRLAG